MSTDQSPADSFANMIEMDTFTSPSAAADAPEANGIELEIDPPRETTLVDDLTAIANHGAVNAAAVAANNLGSMAGGQMRGVGFSTRDGYITAMRNGVPPHTHSSYMQTLRTTYGMTSADIAALNLPGPMTSSDLPVGAGITHVPTGPSVFDVQREQRRGFVAPPTAPEAIPVANRMQASEMVAGAVAEGHHAIVAWEGSSGLHRGELVAALTAIGRVDWAPKAPNARAQAGSAINRLAGQGYDVRAQRKGVDDVLAANDHAWTVGRVHHAGSIGDKYGTVLVRFTLKGNVLSHVGDDTIAAPVIADYNARMAAEVFKSSDVTNWLKRTLCHQLDAVSFGAMGQLVPARHVEAAKQLTEAVRGAGFGSGWVTGLPVATSDQLRDGIVRGLIDEVTDVTNRIATERQNALEIWTAARAEQLADPVAWGNRKMPSGDIGETRARTHLAELRTIAGRVVAYGQVLGEQRVEQAQRWIRDAIASLETLLGSDYTGISARFAEIWDEIELDRKRAGGVL